jgi:uncharacterized protein with von Willebrand factor type A (vWA) domain
METPASNLNLNAGHLLYNLLLFGRLLRRLGLDASPGRMLDLAHALDHIPIGNKADFRHAARALLIHNRADLPLFDRAFDLFWRRPADSPLPLDLPQPAGTDPPARPLPPGSQGDALPAGNPAPGEPPVLSLARAWSNRETLRRKNFADLTGDELAAVQRLMHALAFQPASRRTRRLRPGAGALPDLRRTLRQAWQTGGEVFNWATRAPKRKPRPLIILADISGSMERYTRLLLHFIYGLAQAHGRAQPVEAFVFSTRLTRITRALRRQRISQALGEVSGAVRDWSGGTRTGDCLKTFNFHWGRRVLGRGAVVLIISDGWDRGDPDLLAGEMARLRRTCRRLIWLNPLLGSAAYQPLTRGIRAALPHVDDFLPVHNLASLEDLAAHLGSLA